MVALPDFTSVFTLYEARLEGAKKLIQVSALNREKNEWARLL